MYFPFYIVLLGKSVLEITRTSPFIPCVLTIFPTLNHFSINTVTSIVFLLINSIFNNNCFCSSQLTPTIPYLYTQLRLGLLVPLIHFLMVAYVIVLFETQLALSFSCRILNFFFKLIFKSCWLEFFVFSSFFISN